MLAHSFNSARSANISADDHDGDILGLIRDYFTTDATDTEPESSGSDDDEEDDTASVSD